MAVSLFFAVFRYFSLFFAIFRCFLVCGSLPHYPYPADASYMWYLRSVMQEEAWNSNFELKNLNFESCNGRFGAKITVLHCFALFFDVFSSVEASPVSILRRCFIYVIFEVSNAKRKLEIQILNSKIWILSCNGSFWRQNHSFHCFHCFSTFSRPWKPLRRPYSADASHVWY